MTDIPTGSKVVKTPGNEEAPMEIDESVLQNTESDIIPLIIGAFSVDKDRNYVNDLTNLRYYLKPAIPPPPIDLKNRTFVPKEEARKPYERLSHITEFLRDRKTEDDFVKNGEVNANIVCNSDVLIAIMTLNTPYGDNKSLFMEAFKFGSTIFLHKVSYKLDYQINESSEYGYKLENLCQASEPDGLSSDTVFEAEEFNIVYKAKIGDLDVVYACEIDCIESVNRKKITDFTQLRRKEFKLVEVKSTQALYFRNMSQYDENSTNEKVNDKKKTKNYLLSWWSSAKLAKKEKFVIGSLGNKLKQENHIVKKIRIRRAKSFFSKILSLKNDSINCVTDVLDKIYKETKGKLSENSETSYCQLEYRLDSRTDPIVFKSKISELKEEMISSAFVNNLRSIKIDSEMSLLTQK